MAAQAMVFDIGNVLVHWEPERLYARLIPDPAERARFLSEICTLAWNERFDRGEPMPEGVEAHAALHPEHAENIRAWWSCWPETFERPINGSHALFRALKRKGVPVFGLTNFAAETFEIAGRMHPILTEFDLVVVSGRERCVKPEPAIYEALEARCGHAPETLFFADDNLANIEAARARGWSAHHFRNADGLADALVEAGLLTPEEAAAA